MSHGGTFTNKAEENITLWGISYLVVCLKTLFLSQKGVTVKQHIVQVSIKNTFYPMVQNESFNPTFLTGGAVELHTT